MVPRTRAHDGSDLWLVLFGIGVWPSRLKSVLHLPQKQTPLPLRASHFRRSFFKPIAPVLQAKALVIQANSLLRKAKALLREAKALLREANSLLREANSLLREANSLLREANLLLREANLLLREANLLLREANLLLSRLDQRCRGENVMSVVASYSRHC